MYSEKLLRIGEVAKILNVKWAAVYKWVTNGEVRFVEVGPPGHRQRTIRIPESEMQRLIRERHSVPIQSSVDGLKIVESLVSDHPESMQGF